MADNIDEKLISYVFQYEILYDIGHKYYYDTTRKENAWEEIAQHMECNFNEVSDLIIFYEFHQRTRLSSAKANSTLTMSVLI